MEQKVIIEMWHNAKGTVSYLVDLSNDSVNLQGGGAILHSESTILDLAYQIVEKSKQNPDFIPKNTQIKTYKVNTVGNYWGNKKQRLDRAGYSWVERLDKDIYKGDKEQFLTDYFGTEFVSIDEFNKHLRDMGRRGLLVKEGRYWRQPKESTEDFSI
jgi:hypothetical protein